MSDIIKIKKPTRRHLSAPQKTFNRLKKKINTLQGELEKHQRRLDESLLFYHHEIQPEEKKLVNILNTFVKLLYERWKKPKVFQKKERRLAKKIILDRIDQIFSFCSPGEVDPEISAIFKKLQGVSYDNIVSEELNSFKKAMEAVFKEQGFNINLSDIDLNDDDQEMTRKIFEAMENADVGIKEEAPVKPKSQKQLEREKRALELQTLQKKGLSGIYKELAKAFHPDLEQDPEQKREKETLMKKLTCAYENDDLHSLLSLEMEWMNRSNHQENLQSDARLKIYNSILGDQVKSLQESIEMSGLHPKYFPLHSYFSEFGSGKILFGLKIVYQQLKEEVNLFEGTVKKLQSSEAEKELQVLMKRFDGL